MLYMIIQEDQEIYFQFSGPEYNGLPSQYEE